MIFLESFSTSGHTVIIDTRIIIDLEDTATQKQIGALQDFFSTTLFEDKMTNLPLFICDVICRYNDLRKDLKINSDNQSNKFDGVPKVNLNTAQLDAAITKIDELIAKLKTAKLLIDCLNKD